MLESSAKSAATEEKKEVTTRVASIGTSLVMLARAKQSRCWDRPTALREWDNGERGRKDRMGTWEISRHSEQCFLLVKSFVIFLLCQTSCSRHRNSLFLFCSGSPQFSFFGNISSFVGRRLSFLLGIQGHAKVLAAMSLCQRNSSQVAKHDSVFCVSSSTDHCENMWSNCLLKRSAKLMQTLSMVSEP